MRKNINQNVIVSGMLNELDRMQKNAFIQEHLEEYNGHKISIEKDYEIFDDNIKTFFFVTKPNGEEILAHISPYETNEIEIIKLWIDAGCPSKNNKERKEKGFFTEKELKEIIKEI